MIAPKNFTCFYCYNHKWGWQKSLCKLFPQKRRVATSDATSVTDATRPEADEHVVHLAVVHAMVFVSFNVSKPGQPGKMGKTFCVNANGGCPMLNTGAYWCTCRCK
jgi:hypothetical protein